MAAWPVPVCNPLSALTFSFSCSSSMRASKQPANPPYWMRPWSSTPPGAGDGELPAAARPGLGDHVLEQMAVELGHPPELEVDALSPSGEAGRAPVELLLEEEEQPRQLDAALGQVLGAERIALLGGELEIDPGLEGELGRDRGEDRDGDRDHEERDASLEFPGPPHQNLGISVLSTMRAWVTYRASRPFSSRA